MINKLDEMNEQLRLWQNVDLLDYLDEGDEIARVEVMSRLVDASRTIDAMRKVVYYDDLAEQLTLL